MSDYCLAASIAAVWDTTSNTRSQHFAYQQVEQYCRLPSSYTDHPATSTAHSHFSALRWFRRRGGSGLLQRGRRGVCGRWFRVLRDLLANARGGGRSALRCSGVYVKSEMGRKAGGWVLLDRDILLLTLRLPSFCPLHGTGIENSTARGKSRAMVLLDYYTEVAAEAAGADPGRKSSR